MDTKIPMALADFPDWRAERDKLVELQHQLNDNAEQQRKHPPPDATLSRRSRDATALLDGVTPADGPEWAEESALLQAAGHVLEKAISIHKARMGVLQGRLSKRICELLVKRHRALVADVSETHARQRPHRPARIQGGGG